MNVNDYWREVNRAKHHNPEWRFGQAAFNVLHANFPDLANAIRGTEVDPFHLPESNDFYIHPRWDLFVEYVNSSIPDYIHDLEGPGWDALRQQP
jgi:hypothetical protein